MSLRDLIPFGNRESSVPVRARERREDPFYRLHDEMNRLFEDFLPDFFGRSSIPARSQSGWAFSPDVSVTETKKDIIIKAELPGVDEEGLDVRLEENVLTIRGEKNEEKDVDEGSYYLRERRYGSFERSIPLGAQVDPEKVEASCKKGVLTVRLPKLHETEPSGTRIPIST